MNNKSIRELFEAWNTYVKEKMPADYEWHEVSGIYSLFGFSKVRYNKENPHAIDLMKADGTIYYAVYPTGVTIECERR